MQVAFFDGTCVFWPSGEYGAVTMRCDALVGDAGHVVRANRPCLPP
jgi:hypothetical protein